MYRIRFALIMLKCFLSKKKDILARFDLNFRVVPLLDTDVTRLFTQTYTAMTGAGRWHYVFSSTFKEVALKRRWIPVTTAETFHFKKSIRACEKIQLITKVECWNERCFFLRQEFFVRGELRAVAISEGIVRSPSGHLKPPEVFKELGVTTPSPPMPSDIKAWYSMRATAQF